MKERIQRRLKKLQRKVNPQLHQTIPTPSSLYSRPVSEWTKDEMAAEMVRVFVQEMQRAFPPECNVWGVPFPEKSFTPYLAGAGGPKPSGMKPQASPSVSPSGHPAPSETTERPEDSSNSTSRPGSVTPEKTPNNGPTLSLTGESRSQPTTTTSGGAISRGNSGRANRDCACDSCVKERDA